MGDDWTPGDGSMIDRLWLADWRRQVAALYDDVRRLSIADPAAAHRHWREERERLFQEHPQSPVQRPLRPRFAADHFAYDPALRFTVAIEPTATRAVGALEVRLPASAGEALNFSRIGRVAVPFIDRPRHLSVFWMTGYAGGLFIPFRDATSGVETYAAGRYLIDGAKGADLGGDPAASTLILDFNFAFQPSCAFDPRWACPLAPAENHLDVAIRAGERLTGTGTAGDTQA